MGILQARYAGKTSEEAVDALTACLIISELLGCNEAANNTIEAMVKINRASLICTCRSPFVAPTSEGSGKRLKSIEQTKQQSLSVPVDMSRFNAEQPDIDVPVKRKNIFQEILDAPRILESEISHRNHRDCPKP